MNLLIPLLQTLAVAIGSFGVFALLTSYLRYRKMQLLALDQAGQRISPATAVLLILTRLQEEKASGQKCLLGIRPSKLKLDSIPDFRGFVRQNLRTQDHVFQLENGEILALLQCPEENLAAAARRLLSLFREAGFQDGSLRITLPERDSKALLTWLEAETPVSDSEMDWNITPTEWSSKVLDTSHSEMEAESTGQNPMVDSLTGVLRAVYVPQALRRFFAVIRRSGKSASLVRVEVDELSSYTSTYGEEAGNELFRLTAKVLMENCRETDLIGRYEEDAFVLGIAGENENLLHAAFRMSEVIKTRTLKLDGNEIRFSASFGLASMPGDGKNPMLLLQRATLALAEAKQRGRGMCVAYQPALKPLSASTSNNENLPESF